MLTRTVSHFTGGSVCPTKSSLDCSGHGVCGLATKECSCEAGWTGRDCASETHTCNTASHSARTAPEYSALF